MRWPGGGEKLFGVIPEVEEPPRSWPELPAPPESLPLPCRLLATTCDDDLPGDLQSLSWLTAVDAEAAAAASGRGGTWAAPVYHTCTQVGTGVGGRGGGRVGVGLGDGERQRPVLPVNQGVAVGQSVSLSRPQFLPHKWD